MKGDFSKWTLKPNKNFNGVLHQQGKVLLDSDWNDQFMLNNNWQKTAGKDMLGAHVFAVPVEDSDGFKVVQAQLDGSKVVVELNPGHGWLDGYLTYLEGQGNQKRTASYLPFSTGNEETIDEGVRDAVVLEVWQEAVHGYQLPDQLIEPALGGPDTTERMQTSYALRLLRLEETDHCRNIKAKLQDDSSVFGKLEASLIPTTVAGDECPVVQQGGYTGFEHNLYRIEMAHLDNQADGSRFKWSPLNGGLVGRGDYDGSISDKKKITITANLTAITSLYRKEFYMEMVEYNEASGNWNVIFGADCVLNGNVLELGKEWYTKKAPADSNVFFRLWHGTDLISAYQKPVGSADPVELIDGVRLAFDSEETTLYRPGDFWTFSVRAGQEADDEPLMADQLPQGIVYHRAPLGIINWDEKKSADFEEDEIDDCRRRFKPLTNQKVCCTFTIGDGTRTQGDFNDFDEALRHLPLEGGQLCLLPGVHKINTTIDERINVKISGCGAQTIIHPDPGTPDLPLFDVIDSQEIEITNLTMMTISGTAIRMQQSSEGELPLENIVVKENQIAGLHHAIAISEGKKITITDNHLAVFDKEKGGTVLFIDGEESLIANNKITVIPNPAQLEEMDPSDDSAEGAADYFDPCADEVALYASDDNVAMLVGMIFIITTVVGTYISTYQYKAQGGIQLASNSEKIDITDNVILGGYGNGIGLGSLPYIPDFENPFAVYDLTAEQYKFLFSKFTGYVYDIRILNNDIRQMGLNGVGVSHYFDMEKFELMMTAVNITITGNTITKCALQIPSSPAMIPVEMKKRIGVGGISLADVETAIIRDNRIEENGLSQLEPICGVFVLHGEDIEVSRNRIVNNGPKEGTDDVHAMQGMRGGVVLAMALQLGRPAGTNAKTLDSVLSEVEHARGGGTLAVGTNPDGSHDHISDHASDPASNPGGSSDTGTTTDNGADELKAAKQPEVETIPAARIHDNYIVQPLGHALYMMAMGIVTVVNNVMTSHGILKWEGGQSLQLLRSREVANESGCVFIANLGYAKDLLDLKNLGSVNNIPKRNIAYKTMYASVINHNIGAVGASEREGMEVNPGTGLGTGQRIPNAIFDESHLYWPSGSVLFSTNRVTLDLRSDDKDLTSSAIMITARYDDVAFQNNQCECLLANDLVFFNTNIVATSLRTTNNRFSESPNKVKASLMSYATLNTTTGNQATHCLLDVGHALFKTTANNVVVNNISCKVINDGLNTHLNILQQSAGSILAQANQTGQSVLQLLG